MQQTEGIKCLCFEIAGKAYIVPQSVVSEVLQDHGEFTAAGALPWRGMTVPVLGGEGAQPSGRCLLVMRGLYGLLDSPYYAIAVQSPPRPLVLEQDLLPAQGTCGDRDHPSACEFRMGGNNYLIPDMRAMERRLLPR